MLGWIVSALLAVHGAAPAPAPVPKIVVKVTGEPADLAKYISWLDLRSVRTGGDGEPLYTLDIHVKQQPNGLYVRVALSEKGQTLADREHTCPDTPCLDAGRNPARVREEVTNLLDEVLFKDRGAFGYLILVDCDGPFKDNSAVLNVRPSSVLVIERGFYHLWWYDKAKGILLEDTLHYLEPTTDRLTELTKARFTTARGSVMTHTTPKWMQQFCAIKSPPMQFALVMQLRPPDTTSKTLVPNHDTVVGPK
jgi:hypothetical protein